MLTLLISLFSCLVILYLLMPLAAYLGIVDMPGGRKQHSKAIPTVGGLAMFVAALVGLISQHLLIGEAAILFTCSAAMVALGQLDDMFNLSVRSRLFFQIILVTILIYGTDSFISDLGPLFGMKLPLGYLTAPFTVFAFIGGINAINMIDGVDGLAGKMAVITISGVATLFYISGAFGYLPIIWAMLGALLGFLVLNSRIFYKQACVFMGDAGSMWLGLVLGWFMVKVTQNQVAAEPALVFWLFGIPLLDTLTVIFRRMSSKKSPFSADRSHIHYLLKDRGISTKQVVQILSVVQILFVSVGVGFYYYHASAQLIFWSFVFLFVNYYIAINYLLTKVRRFAL